MTATFGFAPGTVAMWFALVAGIATIAVYLRAMRLEPAAGAAPSGAFLETIGFARRLYAAFAGSILLASALLFLLLLRHDFRLAYVTSYSGRDLPVYYLVSTFWAGQEGSFLLWLLWGSIIGFFVLRSAKEQEPPVMIVYTLTFLGIVAILVKQSPFRFLAEVPPDGSGLNPLLQDPWMVIHPPVMFAGFASLSVPFAFAIAALWRKRWDGWVVRAMPWALFTFVTLGTAILMGGYWAYKTLGWGGYWAWDPVENTSLVPWLATAALVHGMFLQRAREKHRKINLILAILAFCCILYGTFLTRSGVLADFSVHSFVDLGITSWLVGIIVVFLGGGLALLAWRWKEIPVVAEVDAVTGKEKEEPFLSRSVLFILAVTLFCASSVVILLGTSAPLLTRITGKPSQVATSFYNVTHAPVAMLMALLVALVPFVSWRGESWGRVARKALVPAALGVLGALLFFLLGVHAVRDLLILGLSVFGLAASLQVVVLYVRRKAISTMGGYLAHVGMAIMLAGILVSGAYETKTQVTLERGKPVSLEKNGRKLQLAFTGLYFVTDDGTVKRADQLDMSSLSDRRAKQAMEVTVTQGKKVWKAYPKMYVNPRTNQLMANPDVESTPLGDLYISPQSYDPGQAPKAEGTVVQLRKGEETDVHGVKIRFLDFDVDMSQMSGEAKTVKVTGKFTVTGPKGAADQTATYTMHLGGAAGMQDSEHPDTAIAGTAGRFHIHKVSASDGTVELEVLGLDPSGDVKAATPETFSIDVTSKPLISLVWGGFYVLMAGGILALVRRSREAHKASLA